MREIASVVPPSQRRVQFWTVFAKDLYESGEIWRLKQSPAQKEGFAVPPIREIASVVPPAMIQDFGFKIQN